MSTWIPAELRRVVYTRAGGKCEYCLRHDSDSALPHQPDHITSRRHGGETTAENLALACFVCNLLKGPEVASLDPHTGAAAKLYHPRVDRWSDHFRLAGGRILGLTPEGRATAELLQFNREDLIEMRLVLIAKGRYP
jgi:hypothetical protein